MAVLRAGLSKQPAEHDHAAMDMLRAATGRGDIVIDRRASGRPRLAPPYPELSVSMSFRDGLLLVGFDPERAVGVDIESGSPGGSFDARRLAHDHFAPAEADAIGALSDAAARDLFLRLWVAKEAVLKLTGRGIYDGVREPDLSGHIEAVLRHGGVIAFGSAVLVLCRPALPDIAAPPYCAMARAH